MQVTSDTLFHFTTSAKNLENILLKKFLLTYCHEKYFVDYETHDSYYPMISFCDIPLSLTKKQIDRYGSYAIGMTKDWGIKNNLNPVVYIEKNSLLAKDIQGTIDSMGEITKVISTQIKNTSISKKKALKKYVEKATGYIKNFTPENKALALGELKDAIEYLQDSTYQDFDMLIKALKKTVNNNGTLFRYIKNYQGYLTRNEKPSPDYRFYDEREWRYVPSINDSRVKQSLSVEEFKEYRGSNKQKPFIKNINLSFTSEDIKYLIVKSNRDIPKLIRTIKSADNFTKNPNDADILTTRILTIEQLNNDF